MKIGLNIRIVIHWITAISISVLLLYYIDTNRQLFSILIGFSVLTLFINQTETLRFRSDKLVIIGRIFLIVPIYRKSFELVEIKELSIEENISENFNVDFEAAILSKIVTGAYFYEPKYPLYIKLKNNNEYKKELSLTKKGLKKLKLFLHAKLQGKFIL